MSQSNAERVAVAEKFLAGAIVRSPGEADDVLAAVAADDIVSFGPRTILEAAAVLRQRNTLPQMQALHIQISVAGHAADFAADGGLGPYLANLFVDHPTSIGWEYYAGVVREAAAFRKLERIAGELIQDAANPVEPAEEVAARHVKALDAIAADPTANDAVFLPDALPESLAEVRKRAAREVGDIRSGLDTIDRWVPGFEPGQLVIIAARTSVGKTALALKTALHVSAGLGRPVYFASLEMSRVEVAQRLGCMVTGKNAHRFKSGEATLDEIDEFERLARVELDGAKMWIDDNATLRVEQIVRGARKIKRKHGLSLVVVDYLQLISPSDRRADRRETVEHASRTLKKAARELGCPVFALAQLNREVESRPDHKPRLSDIREAGGVEQDADVVLMLWKTPGQDDREPVHQIGVHVAKNRSGPIGEDVLDYRRACTRFEDRFPQM
jgi:replicative DNA helicase